MLVTVGRCGVLAWGTRGGRAISDIEIPQGWSARRAFFRELPRRLRRQLLVPWSDPIFRDPVTAALALGYGRYVWSWRFAVQGLLFGVGLLAVAVALLPLLPTFDGIHWVSFAASYLVPLGVNLYVGHKLKRRAGEYLERHTGDEPG